MVIFAAAIFIISLAGMIALFALNIREARTGRYFAPEWRREVDKEALYLKELLMAADLDLKKVPPILSHSSHVALHFAALAFARLARNASRRAHALADFVSHNHNFERKETRSEFLRKMTELKSGGGDAAGSDTANE